MQFESWQRAVPARPAAGPSSVPELGLGRASAGVRIAIQCVVAPNWAPSIRGTQDNDSSQKVVTNTGPGLHPTGTPRGRRVPT